MRVPFRRGEHDVQLIQGAEAREKRLERRGSRVRPAAGATARRRRRTAVGRRQSTTASTRSCPRHQRATAVRSTMTMSCVSGNAQLRRPVSRHEHRTDRGRVGTTSSNVHQLGVAVRKRHPHRGEQQRRADRPTDRARHAFAESASASAPSSRDTRAAGRSVSRDLDVEMPAQLGRRCCPAKYFCTRRWRRADVRLLPDVPARPGDRHLVVVNQNDARLRRRCSAARRATGAPRRARRATSGRDEKRRRRRLGERGRQRLERLDHASAPRRYRSSNGSAVDARWLRAATVPARNADQNDAERTQRCSRAPRRWTACGPNGNVRAACHRRSPSLALAIVSAFGTSQDAFRDALLDGRTGVAPIKSASTRRVPYHPGRAGDRLRAARGFLR